MQAVDAGARGERRPLGLDALAAWLLGATLVVWPLALVAFWPRYLSQLPQADGYRHAHALLGSAWMALLVLQPVLVRQRRLAAHRMVGRVGILVGVGFVVAGVLSAHRMLLAMDAERYARDGFFLYMVLAVTVIFAAALWLGVAWRHVPAVHGRFMACTLLPLLDPVLARLLGFHGPPLPDAAYQLPALLLSVVALGALWWTLPQRSPGRASFGVFALASIGLLLLHYASEGNAAWLEVVDAFRDLPLT